jgi:hypothetical protein
MVNMTSPEPICAFSRDRRRFLGPNHALGGMVCLETSLTTLGHSMPLGHDFEPKLSISSGLQNA